MVFLQLIKMLSLQMHHKLSHILGKLEVRCWLFVIRLLLSYYYY